MQTTLLLTPTPRKTYRIWLADSLLSPKAMGSLSVSRRLWFYFSLPQHPWKKNHVYWLMTKGWTMLSICHALEAVTQLLAAWQIHNQSHRSDQFFFGRLRKRIWYEKWPALKTKIAVYPCVLPFLLYGSESLPTDATINDWKKFHHRWLEK